MVTPYFFQIRPAGSAFSYLNPENSAIKDLLIKTYEDKGIPSAALQATVVLQQQQLASSISATTTPATATDLSARDSSDSTSQRQFKAPAGTTSIVATPPVPQQQRTGPLATAAHYQHANGIHYSISSDQRSGSLVVPDLRDANNGHGSGNGSTNAAGWIVSPGQEWVSVDEVRTHRGEVHRFTAKNSLK